MADDKESILDNITDAVESRFVVAKAAVASSLPLSQSDEEARVKNINYLLQMDMPRQLKKHEFLGNFTPYGAELGRIAQHVNWRIAEIGLPSVAGGKIHFINTDQLTYGTKGAVKSCTRSGMDEDRCEELAENMRDQFMQAAARRQKYGEDFMARYKSELWPHSQPVNGDFSSAVVVPHLRGDEFDHFMTPREANRFTNYHEAWHSLHPDYDKALEKEWYSKSKSPDEVDRLRIKQESVADLGGIAEMIQQENAPADFANKVRDREMQGDLEHISSFSADAFRQKIEAMGVETFRSLGSKELYSMIIETVEENTPTAAQVKYMRQEMSKQKPDYPPTGDAETDAFAAKFRAFRDRSDEAAKTPYAARPPRGPNMREELLNRAFGLGKAITPASLLLAHQEMRLEMQSGSATGSTKRNYDGDLVDLQSAFAQMTSNNPGSVDYVAENLKRGLTLDQVEKAAKDSIDVAPVHRKVIVTPPLDL